MLQFCAGVMGLQYPKVHIMSLCFEEILRFIIGHTTVVFVQLLGLVVVIARPGLDFLSLFVLALNYSYVYNTHCTVVYCINPMLLPVMYSVQEEFFIFP